MLPEKYTESLLEIERWFLEEYQHDAVEEIQLRKIIENLKTKKYDLVFTKSNFWILEDSIRWVDSPDSTCPVERETVQQIGKLLKELENKQDNTDT